jgi:hypothetical protein
MATAPEALAQEPPETGQDDTPIDYTVEATKMGWKPPEQFNGDPSRHVDAETFYKRGQEMMPILKAQNKTLLKRLEIAEKDAKRAADFFSKAEQRAYERAVAEIRAEQEAAVESGDMAAHRAAADKLDKLEKPAALAKADERTDEQRAEEFADWGKANKWYAADPVMQAYANAQAQAIASAKGGFLDRADLDAVTEKVKAKFEDEFPEVFAAAAKPKPRNPVEGVPVGRPRSGGNTYADLPPEAKATCDKWVKNGIIKSPDDYVKNFDFKGWNK